MSCRICRRGSCTESFHSFEEQEKLAERDAMTDDVDVLRRRIQELEAEIKELKSSTWKEDV